MEESDEQATLLYDGGSRCSIFVIDYGEHMFDEGQHCFRTALEGVRNQLNYICCSGDQNEYAGVIFINTSNTNKEAENIDCIYVHRPLGSLDAEYVKELDSLIKSDNIVAELSPALGESGTCNWAEVLFLIQRLLTYSGTVIRKKSVYFITRNHDPISGDESILDLRSKDVQLAVFLVDGGEEETDQFWAEIDPYASQSSSIDQLQTQIKRKNFSLRATTSIPFKMGEGLEFAVGVYILIKEQSKPAAIPLDAETNERLEYRTHYVCDDEKTKKEVKEEKAENVEPLDEHFEGDVKFSRKIGEVDVVLDRKEMENLRRFDKPGIYVIGFKPISLLKASHRMSPSKYVFPLESAITGSNTMYRALYQRCLDRQLFILIRYTGRANTTPQLAALVPQAKIEEEDDQLSHSYEGFHLVELPFAEDKRNLKEKYQPPEGEEWPSASEEQVDAAKQFVSKLTTRYMPDQFANPTLQTYYKGLEAMALDLEVDLENNKGLDNIRPYYENSSLQKRVARQLEMFKGTCVPAEVAEPVKKGGRKNKALDYEDEGTTSKRGRKK
ncbi:ku70/Ku80 beta-barrel domain-containing protein [Ditylenchus destructor]|uniref:Ku70/Ku80 beta-barrel domain-containing protein n=1 Tax=Ditylenchus destructor TaxID=166010 RepID=A0AAD4R852_9BILA|nr:ku70/Ku80 beta-barrel domain-containing protein [Ditylenchus destructor]